MERRIRITDNLTILQEIEESTDIAVVEDVEVEIGEGKQFRGIKSKVI